jgi:hypothetical protein
MHAPRALCTFVYTTDMMGRGALARIAPRTRRGAMKHIPFAALPLHERSAVLAALERSGIEPRIVCVSRMESEGESLPGMALVSAPGWVRAYESGGDWIGLLERDLGSLGRR